MGRGPRLLVCLSLALTVGCTKVNEQPPPPPVVEPPPPPPRPGRNRPVQTPGTHVRALGGAPRPAAQPARAVDAASPAVASTLNGDPNGPRREDLQKALDSALPSLQPCFADTQGSVKVSLAFNATPSGRAEAVRVTGGGAAVDSCLTRALAQVKLPQFAGDAVPVQFPLSIERTVTRAPAAPAAPANQPAAPVFVNP